MMKNACKTKKFQQKKKRIFLVTVFTRSWLMMCTNSHLICHSVWPQSWGALDCRTTLFNENLSENFQNFRWINLSANNVNLQSGAHWQQRPMLWLMRRLNNDCLKLLCNQKAPHFIVEFGTYHLYPSPPPLHPVNCELVRWPYNELMV